jgi:hypothetical protein
MRFESAGKRTRSRQQAWATLVAPWAAIVMVACIAAITIAVQNEHSQDVTVDDSWHLFSFGRRGMLDASHVSGAVHPHSPIFREEHPPLFPLKTSDYYGLFFAVVGLILAAGGGIGGGGILVPIYILVMGFSPKHAVPLSNVTVFGGAVANVILNSGKRHPIADRPLVDWDLILVMEPLTIAGVRTRLLLCKASFCIVRGSCLLFLCPFFSGADWCFSQQAVTRTVADSPIGPTTHFYVLGDSYESNENVQT